MKKYTKPTMNGEIFTTNEYIAACWGVGCNTTAANKIEDLLHNNPIGGHRASECGRFDQQAVVVNKENVVVGMRELDTYWGTLNCTIYTDDSFDTPATATQLAEIKAGDTIYWITTYGRNVYHHVGTVGSTIQGKPNAS